VISRGLVGTVLVLLGGLTTATLPPSTALLRHDDLAQLRQADLGRVAGLVAVLVGLALVAHAWLSLCRRVAAPADEGESLALVRFATVVWCAPLLLAPPLFSRDGWSYAAQGAMTALGISPYEHGPAVLGGPIVQAVDPLWLHTAAPYGPLPLWYGAAAAAHTGNPWMLVIAHRVLALVGLALLAWAVPRLAAWSRVNPALATAVVVASPATLATGVAGLHNDLLMAGLMAMALVLAAERGWVAGAAVGGLAAAVKAPGGLVCIGVALVSLAPHVGTAERLRRLAAVAGVAVGTLLAVGVLSGVGSGWLRTLTVPAEVDTPLSVTTQLGGRLDRVAADLGLGLPPGTLLELAQRLGLLVALGVAGWVALRWATGDPSRAARATAVVVGAVVVLGPAVHLWYLLWPLPFVASVARGRPAATALSVAGVATGLLAPVRDDVGAVAIALLVLAAIVLTRRGPVAGQRSQAVSFSGEASDQARANRSRSSSASTSSPWWSRP
jgi:alpha-1,6-mannosyltransferase